jgi:hypothetical protein
VAALDLIQSYELDLYVGINLSSVPGFLVAKLPEEYFQIRFDGKPAVKSRVTPLLNFAHSQGRKLMTGYYSDVLNLLKNYPNVREAIPLFTWDAETEYPHQIQTGYSPAMRTAFQNYLMEEYDNDIQSLNRKWQRGNHSTSYHTFNEINIDPSWGDPDNVYDEFGNYRNSYGRIEWINFKTEQLNDLLSIFVAENHRVGYRLPLQTGCTFDALIERRGWYDYTPLLENTDGVRVADIAGREESFEFHANYIRSLLEYWNWVNRKEKTDRYSPYVFSTESNWPGYSNYSPEQLTTIWSRQLRAFYLQGAETHFIHSWFNLANPDLLLDSYQPYKAWIDSLGQYRNKPIVKPATPTSAIFYSSLRSAVYHGYDRERKTELENFESLVPYHKDFQIITDYMVQENPEYLNQFKELFFTSNSEIMSESTLQDLLNPVIKTQFIITTYNDPEKKYLKVPGFRDETGKLRHDYKVNFIWRTRTDIQALFPSANKCDSLEAKRINWPPDKDFIDWCVEYGNVEYENCGVTYQNWHSTPAALWESDPELQEKFPDGYHSEDGSGQTMLDFMVQYAENKEDEQLKIFHIWPGIASHTKKDSRESRLNRGSRESHISLDKYQAR